MEKLEATNLTKEDPFTGETSNYKDKLAENKKKCNSR
jgi:hypothetical protein